MKTRLLISAFCFLLSALASAAGFGQSLAFKANAGKGPAASGGAPSYVPLTNYASCIGQWVGDLAQTNTSGQVTNLPDQWINAWHLTNFTSAQFPQITNNALNGHAIVSWDGNNDVLRSQMLNCTQITEYVMLMRYDRPPQTTGDRIVETFTSGSGQSFRFTSGGQYQIAAAGSTANGGAVMTNKWAVWSLILSNSTAYLHTNSILDTVFVVGSAQGQTNIAFGNRDDLSRGAAMSIAEMAIFSGAVPGTNYIGRSNVFNYFTNNYGVHTSW